MASLNARAKQGNEPTNWMSEEQALTSTEEEQQ